jgi:hypothetical protein
MNIQLAAFSFVDLNVGWWRAPLVAALLLTFTGAAQAAPFVVGLAIKNDLDSNGNISVINGSKVKVAYMVDDPGKNSNKADKIQLLRVSDDSVVSSVERGKKKSGTVSLLVKKSENEQLYVRYREKGTGKVFTVISHPDDPDYIPLWSIPKASLGDVTIGLNALENPEGAASISGVAFRNENSDTDQETQCQLKHTSTYSYYRAVAGADSASCDAFADIRLPHGRTLTGLSCTVYDDTGTSGIRIKFNLIRVSLSEETDSKLFETPRSTGVDQREQLSDTTIDNPANGIVDNKAFTYKIYANFSTNDFSSIGDNGRLYGCSVSYR